MRVRSVLSLAGLVVFLATCGGKPGRHSAQKPRPFAKPYTGSVLITSQSIDANNGVPSGWRFTVPPGDPATGRQVFTDFGCGSCHVIKGEELPGAKTGGVGPDLTGMGSHRPAGYLVESILDPDKVVIKGPGYYDEATGRSIMPAYPEMTLVQLMDVVAYLKSLRDPDVPEAGPAAASASTEVQLPEPPAQRPAAFYVQVYDVRNGQLAAFEEWFKTEGVAAFRGCEGLVSMDTYVNTLQAPRPSVVTMWGFKDETSRNRFASDPKLEELGNRFDSFIGAHEHLTFSSPPIYRAGSLSTP